MIPPRKFLFAVVVLTFIQFNKTLALDPATAALLIQEGTKFLAPFTEAAHKQIFSHFFGAGKGARSSDVVIFNLSSKTFRLGHSECSWGSFTIFPEHDLPAHHSTVFGAVNTYVLHGLNCVVKYRSSGGSWFSLDVEHPFWTKSRADQTHSSDLHIIHTRGGGTNNQVRFIVRDA